MESDPHLAHPSALSQPRVCYTDSSEIEVKETWLCYLLSGPPELPDRFRVRNTFFTNAPEINSQPSLKDQTYNFRGCDTWYAIGLQLLEAAGWRPDCVQADVLNVVRSLPPKCVHTGAWIAVGRAETMRWDHSTSPPDNTSPDALDRSALLDIETATFFMKKS